MMTLALLPLIPYALVLFAADKGDALRTGAPAIACINLRPFHGLNRAKPASASQFFVTQSSLTYAPGQNITVELATHSTERYFRGFIVQAYDPISSTQIGHFLPGADSRPIDSCSAATHKSNLNKRLVAITWLPPAFLGYQADNSFASQWLGIRNSPIQPSLSFSVGHGQQRRRRQYDNETTTAAASVDPATASQPPNSVAPVSQPDNNAANQQYGLRQVRFRATIVVSYEEFYTGFESSDQSFERFDYAMAPITTNSSPKPATGGYR